MTTAWAGGASAGQIAAKLGGFETTKDRGRSAVLGKLHRLGLSRSRETNSQRLQRIDKRRRLRREAAKIAPVAVKVEANPLPIAANPPQPLAPDVARVLSLVDLEAHHCRWPVGDPLQGFCGDHRAEGRPYCPRHCSRAYTKPAPRPTSQKEYVAPGGRTYSNAVRWT